MEIRKRWGASVIFKSLGVRASIFLACVYLASVYGSSRDIRKFGGHVDRPVVDGTGNLRPDRRGDQSAFLPGFSGTMSPGVGRGLGCLWGVSVDGGHERAARRIDNDEDDDGGGIRAGRLGAGHGIVRRGSADLVARETRVDRIAGSLVGADGLRRHAPVLFSGFENPGAGGGRSLPADGRCRLGPAVSFPVRAVLRS